MCREEHQSCHDEPQSKHVNGFTVVFEEIESTTPQNVTWHRYVTNF